MAPKGEVAEVIPRASGPQPRSPSPDLVLFSHVSLLRSPDMPGVGPWPGEVINKRGFIFSPLSCVLCSI